MSFLGLNQSSRNRFFYHTPYQDIAQTYLPVTVKELFQYTKYYYRTNPVIAPTIDKMAEYPITSFVIDQQDDEFKEKVLGLIDTDLELRENIIAMGQDWGVFGNSFVSILYPFIRYIICKKCGYRKNIEHTDKWKYTDGKWRMFCFNCKMDSEAYIEDSWVRDPKRLKFHRWTVEQIDIQYNPFTGDREYYYRISPRERKLIQSGVKHYIAKTPKVFLSAVKNGKDVRLNKENLFHFKRTSISDDQLAWGMPVMYPALKEAFHWQVLRKANEAISFQYIIPLTIIFPQPHGEANPYTHLNTSTWKNFVEGQINRWKRDPNHIPVMPIPLGSQQIFGNARALMVGPEMQQVADNIIAACQVPREFVYGGLSYSGTSVSLRMLENHFLIYREQMTRFLKWISCKIYTFLQWPKFTVRLSDFKMADDIQKKQFIMALAQQGIVSWDFILEDSGLDFIEEQKKKKDEIRRMGETAKLQQIESADAQGEAMKIQMKYQAEAEVEGQSYKKKLLEDVGKESERKDILQTMENPFGPDTMFAQFDPMQLAAMTLDKLKQMPADSRDNQLKMLQDQYPQLVSVMNRVAQQKIQFNREMQMADSQEAPGLQGNMGQQSIGQSPQGAANNQPVEQPSLEELASNPMQPSKKPEQAKPMPEQKPPRRGPGKSTI